MTSDSASSLTSSIALPHSYDVSRNPSSLPLWLLPFQRGPVQSRRCFRHPPHLPQPALVVQPAPRTRCHQRVHGDWKFSHAAKEPSEAHDDQREERHGDQRKPVLQEPIGDQREGPPHQILLQLCPLLLHLLFLPV